MYVRLCALYLSVVITYIDVFVSSICQKDQEVKIQRRCALIRANTNTLFFSFLVQTVADTTDVFDPRTGM